MIYLNNAGTSWPKPEEVNEAIKEFSKLDPGAWDSVYHEGLSMVESFFNINDPERFLFTSGCTSSISIALHDFHWKAGDRLLISSMEHHALSRWVPLLLQNRGVETIIISRTQDHVIDMDILEKELSQGARMVAVTMASNVTGEILPYEQIVRLAHQYGALCLLDGAQTAGVIPIDIGLLNPDIFVFAGHKGLLGAQGIGGLYISPSVEMICPSAVCEIDVQAKKSKAFPSYCDTGSLNMQGLAGLTAGMKWLQKRSWSKLISERMEKTSFLRESLNDMSGINILGGDPVEKTTGVLAISVPDKPHQVIAAKLINDYAIKVGVGFQCAPLTHETLGTEEDGCLRFSVSPLTSLQELAFFINKFQKVLKVV